MEIDNKGFTFIEILAVIVIISLLTGISIAAFSRYKENAKSKDYEALALASKNAMDEYMMSHPYEEGVSLEELEKSQLLSNRKDPGTKEDCTGSVKILKEEGNNSKIDSSSYEVNLCCPTYKKTYIYENNKKEPSIQNITNTEACDYTPEEEVVPPTQPIICAAGKFLRKGHTTCELCLSKYYCLGGTFYYSSTTNQGLTPCPTGYENSAAGSKKITDCFIKVPNNKYIKTPRATTPTNCEAEKTSTAHDVFYESTSSCKLKQYTIKIKDNSIGLESVKIVINGVEKNIAKGDKFTTFTVDSGTNITLKAIPKVYYKFDNWTINGTEYKENNKTITVRNNLNIVSKGDSNKIFYQFHANNGHLTPHKHQVCPIKAGCTENQCVWQPGGKELEGCNSRTNIVYKAPKGAYILSDVWKEEGLRDYNGGTLHMTKTGYTATGYWIVDNTSTKIHQTVKFNTIDEFLEKVPKSYRNKLKTQDVEITFYAQWKKN